MGSGQGRGLLTRIEPISLGNRKALLVDHHFVDQADGVRLRIHPPRKTGERLLESEHPWENATLNWFSVLKVGRSYRMWYECYDVDGWPTTDDTSFCLAESRDGVHWRKPELGRVSYRGSTNNNILFRQIGSGGHRSRVHGSCVFLDPSAPPEARYRCVSQGLFQGIGERPYFVAGMSSPDGIAWTRHPEPICPVFADSQYSGFHDPRTGRLVIYGRVSGRGGRAIGSAPSARFSGFAPLEKVLECSEQDPPGVDLYNPACMRYPGEDDLYLMFPSVFRHREDTLEIRLAVSRDGVHWSWPDRETAFIGLGKDGGFDSGSLTMGNGGCVPTGRDWSFFFSGSKLRHAEVELPQLADPSNRRVISRAIGRPDRLVSVTSEGKRGTFTTPPMVLGNGRLRVNARVGRLGVLRVAVLDVVGNPLPGFESRDCQPIVGNSATHGVRWGRGSGRVPGDGAPVRLRFEMDDVDLFSFRVEP